MTNIKKGENTVAKNYRGKTLNGKPGRTRGTCPLCGKTRIKLLYPHTVDGTNITVCKNCRNK